MGVLNVMHEIDQQAKPLPMKALQNLDQEIILGMDFCKLFDVDAQLGRGVWRVRKGRSRPFAKTGEEKNSVIYAECAEISDTYRFCVDYRDLNNVTRRDAYPIPNMDTILHKLRQVRYLTKIDLRLAYFQIPLEKASRKYTAFVLPGSGLWQFTRMPFGLMNAPSTFQRLIDTLFGPEMQPNVFGYLDDIVIVTELFEDHLYLIKVV